MDDGHSGPGDVNLVSHATDNFLCYFHRFNNSAQNDFSATCNTTTGQWEPAPSACISNYFPRRSQTHKLLKRLINTRSILTLNITFQKFQTPARAYHQAQREEFFLTQTILGMRSVLDVRTVTDSNIALMIP